MAVATVGGNSPQRMLLSAEVSQNANELGVTLEAHANSGGSQWSISISRLSFFLFAHPYNMRGRSD